MLRTSLSASALFSILLMAACDDAASEQKKAVLAQSEANTKIVAATNEASEKVASAQAEASSKIAAATNEASQKAKDAQFEADRKIAAANQNFNKLREDYRHTAQTALNEFDRKVTELDAKAKKANGKVRTELNSRVNQIYAQREAFASSYKALETETAITWDATKARLDKEWSELKALVE